MSKTGGGEAMPEAILQANRLVVATGDIGVNDYVAKTSRKKRTLNHLFTFYYPYTFYEWKVTIPRFLFGDTKALIRIGVNGITGLAAQTEMWPETEAKSLRSVDCLAFNVNEQTIDEECMRALENYVYKSLRPMKPPIKVLSRMESIFLPYHVFLENTLKGKERFIVLEALTGVEAEVKKMKELEGWIVGEIRKKRESMGSNFIGQK
jgi:hypothetical protein